MLVKHAVVTESNKARARLCASPWRARVTPSGAPPHAQDALVETFRGMAELLTWGDQHEPAIFDLFVEMRVRCCARVALSEPLFSRADASHGGCQMLAHFVRILVQCAPAAAASRRATGAGGEYTVVAVQLLQSLSILVQNTRRETSIYYLFSNNYINDLMELKQFDYGVDEEVLAWYITFLKAISLRLNERTIQFFVSDAPPAPGTAGGRARSSVAGGDPLAVPVAFPLYSQVIRYVQHTESMVRAAARAATLNVFRVDDPAVRASQRACVLLLAWRARRG